MRNAKDMINDIRNNGLLPCFELPETDTEYHIAASPCGRYMVYGTACNAGLLRHGEVQFDPDLSDDENLQELIAVATEKEA